MGAQPMWQAARFQEVWDVLTDEQRNAVLEGWEAAASEVDDWLAENGEAGLFEPGVREEAKEDSRLLRQHRGMTLHQIDVLQGRRA